MFCLVYELQKKYSVYHRTLALVTTCMEQGCECKVKFGMLKGSKSYCIVPFKHG